MKLEQTQWATRAALGLVVVIACGGCTESRRPARGDAGSGVVLVDADTSALDGAAHERDAEPKATDSGATFDNDAGGALDIDAGVELGVDAGGALDIDAGMELGVDAGGALDIDAGMAPGVDAGDDAGDDAGHDAGNDAGPDAFIGCATGSCAAGSYCDLSTGRCVLGCEVGATCGTNELCSPAHVCECVASTTRCGGACVRNASVEPSCDGRDDDCDGMVDEGCREAAGSCADPILLPSSGGRVMRGMNGMGALTARCGSAYASRGVERVYVWRPERSGTARLVVTGDYWPSTVYVRTASCMGADAVCSSITTEWPTHDLTFSVTAGTAYYLVFDCHYEGTDHTLTHTFTLTPPM